MNFAIYDTTTGNIKRRVSCHPSIAQDQVEQDEELFLNCPDAATHIINDIPLAAPSTADDLLAPIRTRRNDLLNIADTIYCNAERWSAMSAEQRQAWSAYKQVLRDFPATCDPNNPAWPDLPKGDQK